MIKMFVIFGAILFALNLGLVNILAHLPFNALELGMIVLMIVFLLSMLRSGRSHRH